MRGEGLKPDVVTYTSTITANSRAGDWGRVLGLIGAMAEAVRWDAARTQAASHTRSPTPLTPPLLLTPLQGDTSLTPNAFSWSSAIAACERAGEWQKGLAIFTALRDAGALTPSDKEDGALYNAAISAAASGGVVEVATDLLEEMLEAGASPRLPPLAATA